MGRKYRTGFSLTTALFVLNACSTTSEYKPIKELTAKQGDCRLDLVMPGDKIDFKSVDVIGEYMVRDTMASVNCDWPQTLDKNKKQACLRGADGIRFITVEPPTRRSTCTQTSAEFFVYRARG